ncbi:Proteasome subunit beta type-3 isoform 4 [Schistosoma japonicum]|uniref:Proteasome subunit beta n=1 Tax=Schistosoma japonicum TaxID=6182 RepID=C7TYR0_SCHJA|nr:Proteasome subunit beta type-3 [Schistosoma japonicum]TNN11860.1 Proteasome subunit beta type-3 isoform 4 [Schistosoma japonicum]CAX72789.1 proteasome (prosome, macropain) subunit, beta type 3 [Schistosoma japonicum]CAX72850.1 proteasome (prosome, macropain) subunit, beta type 3 [Schistosoma japonicum]CAX82736.1 proteasome (prosome, macropain) subunit, beta type 3 [Schistosoma japonicum]
MSILAHNGSAVIGMSGKDCAAIACDLRFGVNLQTISTDFTKVYSLGPRLYVGFPGLATDNQTVFQRLQFRKNMYELRENRTIKPQTITTMLSNLLYERRFGPYFVEPVVAGIDHTTSKPYVACMDLIGCVCEANDFVVSGTCTEQMYGMCETLWEENMDSKELFECISQCILNALNRDAISGWGARVYLIEKDAVTISDLKMRMD